MSGDSILGLDRPPDPAWFPLLSPVESETAVDQLLGLSGLGVLRLRTFRRFRGRRREKNPIEDGRRERRKENDRQQGISRGNRSQPNRIVTRSQPRSPEIGLSFRKHTAGAHRHRCEKTACFQRKLLPRQIPVFSAVRRLGFIKQSRWTRGSAGPSRATKHTAKVLVGPESNTARPDQ